MNVLPWFAATVCVACLTPSMAMAHAHTIGELGLTAQSASDLTTGDAAGQPASTNDLVIEDLTPEQSAQVEAIIETYQPQIDAATTTYVDVVSGLLEILLPTTPSG